jgi:hypothetical protein
MEPRAHGYNAARSRPACCLVCDQPVPHHGVPSGSHALVCSSPHCRQIASRRADLAPAVFGRLVAIHRRHQREQRARAAEAARQLAERRAIEARENADIHAGLRAASVLPEGPCLPVALPTGLSTLAPLPEERRESYRAHLESILADALSKPDADDSGSSQPNEESATMPLAAELCGRCGGGCCTEGGERAYLNASSIRRVLRTHPWRPEQLVDQYLARLAPETIADACVNQTATGCGLPREMRSDICNNFFCPSLRTWHAACGDGGQQPVALVIQRGFDHWTQHRSGAPNAVTGVYLVSATATRKLAWPPAEPD